MKAVLLAAGQGLRLRPLTLNTPKCLVPINGIPLITFWINLLRKYGITEVLINLSYAVDKVEEYIAANASDLKIRLSFEEKLLGSLGTLLRNMDFFNDADEVFIFYSDNLTNINLYQFLKFHRKHNFPFTMGLFHTNNPTACGIAKLNGKDTIIDFVEKPKNPESDLANAGIYLTSREIFRYLPSTLDKEILDIGFDLLPGLVQHMKGYIISDFLIDVGTISNLQLAEEIVREKPELFPFIK